ADILDGGAGNDTLYGGDGADVFRFGTGYAKDRIRSINNASARLDTVELTDINAADLNIYREGDALVLAHNNGVDRLTIERYFAPSGEVSTVKELKFADGTLWDIATTLAKVKNTYGDDYSNSITVLAGMSGKVFGLGGHDTIYGAALSDVLDGGDGHDTLYGRDGN
ncbi:calcium-binding protein, partial [Cupriavidus sp. DL-D2]|uniref:calcium-binding protein n=1 Tax=Cupriavidus sp. DL-D2 TaxID=3144974 RepID=UPI003212FA2D